MRGPCSKAVHYNDRMLALRFAGLVAVAAWLGGLLALGLVAAPSIFDVMDSSGAEGGRLLAGAIFGEILGRFHVVGYVCAGVILVSLTIRAVLGPRPRHFALATVTVLVMLAASLYSGIVLSARIEALGREIGAAPSTLAEDDARRLEFGRLHAQSMAFQVVPLIGGLLLLFREITE